MYLQRRAVKRPGRPRVTKQTRDAVHLPRGMFCVYMLDAVKTQNRLKFAGVPQTRQSISATSGPKFTIL